MNLLRIALLCNGIFSLSTGISLVIFKHQVAQWFGLDKSLTFLIIGLGLIYFSFTIFKEIKKPNAVAVFFIIVQDLIWVLTSFALLIFQPFNISELGNELILVVSLIVLFFGICQSIGLARIDSVKGTGLKRLTFERIVGASKEETWRKIADVSNYHHFAPNIDSVQILSGQGEGMVRSCAHKKNNWTEIATDWQDGEQYSFEANTEDANYPFPLKHLKGTWKVEEISGNRTKIMMDFEFAYNWKILIIALHPFMKKEFSKISSELLDNWQKSLED